MTKHALWIGDAQRRNSALIFTGDEAKHAMRVKRVRVGERILGLDGAGTLVEGEVTSLGKELTVEIIETTEAPAPYPAIEVWAPTPKGTRSGDLVDTLTQVGAASWVPMRTNRSVSSLSEAKRARLVRVAVEACKQSRRAWLLEIAREASLAQALDCDDGTALVIAEQSGEVVDAAQVGDADRIRLLIGPEGGFTEEEIAQAKQAGASVRSLGPHVMRIEVAAAIGCAALVGARR